MLASSVVAKRPTKPVSVVRVLGVDPGSRVTGYGVIDLSGGVALRYVTSGEIKLSISDHAVRLATIYQRLSEEITQHKPQICAVERVFLHRNPDSALKLGQARGVAMAAASVQGLPVKEYTANQVKQAVVGKGHADKLQIQHMMKVLLGLTQSLGSDEADALAVALCAAYRLRCDDLEVYQS